MAHVVVKLRDTETGDEASYEYDVPDDADVIESQEFMWHEGNYSCDCNRMLFLARGLGREDPDVSCGDNRVVITDATIDGVKQDWK